MRTSKNMRFVKIALITAIAAFSPTLPGWTAAPPGSPMVSGTIVRDYARITFHWAERVNGFSANASGNKLTVRFGRDVNPNFGEILRNLHPYVIKAELASDQRTVIFTLNNAYKTRSFITDNETGVDILGLNRTSQSPAEQNKPAEEKKTEVAAEEKPAAPSAAPEKKITEKKAVEEKLKEPTRKEVAAVQPVKPQEATTKESKTEGLKPAPAKLEVAQQTSLPKATAAPVVTVKETAVETPPIIPSPASAPTASVVPVSAASLSSPIPAKTPPVSADVNALLKQSAQAAAPISGEPLAVTLSMTNKQPTLNFPFTDRVAAASWMQGRTAWILFNRPRTLTGLKEVTKGGEGWLYNVKQYGMADVTLLRIDMLTDVYTIMEKDREGYGWSLRIASSPTMALDSLSAELIKENDKVSTFIPIAEAEGPFVYRDPDTGDISHIVAAYASGTGVAPPRNFIEFNLPATAQGIVVSPIADGIEVTRDARGVYIDVASGMTISKEALNAEEKETAKNEDKIYLFKPTLFPVKKWLAADPDDFAKKEHFFLERATSSQNLLEKNQWRKQLAELYLGAGMENETLGVLGSIRRDDLDFYRENQLAALEGAAQLINYRLPEAQIALSSSVLDKNAEGDLLRKTVAAASSANSEPVPYMQMNDAYIRQYPAALRQRMAIIAANQALQQRDFKTPSLIFATLEDDNMQKGIEGYITFMQGKIAAESGKVKEASRIWENMANNVDDRQFRARAEFALISLGLQEESITPEEALDRLEKLRIVWRGDDLERSVLLTVGQLHVNLGHYWNGMKAWEELMQYYPNTPESSDGYKRLADTFRLLYLDGQYKEMDPVKALALYTEFQELTPIGPEGIKVSQNIADLQVKVDLLDQAAARLQNLVQYRLQGEEKSRVGARLALLYLLNREPEKTIIALQLSRVNDVPAELSLERNRIAAQALIDLKHYDQALTMIEGDYSTEGENVRLEAFSGKKDWAYTVDILENNLRSRPDLQAPLTDEEGSKLVQLALSYIFLGETDQLNFMRQTYLPLMKENKYKEEFLFFTNDIPVSSQNFQKVSEGIATMQNFMENYRKKLKEEPLSEAVGNKAEETPDKKVEDKTGKVKMETLPAAAQEPAATPAPAKSDMENAAPASKADKPATGVTSNEQ